MEIIGRGKPTPEMDGLTQTCKGSVRHFNTENYQRFSWLTASSEINKLFCWPCLLFSTGRGAWSSSGVDNLSSLTKAIGRHQASEQHIMNVVHLKTFGAARVDLQPDEQHRRETTLHNERVKKNRDILTRLIDCVTFLGQQELSFSGGDERSGSPHQPNYMESLTLLSNYDAGLRQQLASAAVFTGASGRIQKDLMDAVAEVLNDAIKKEIGQARFVAIMVDETPDLSNSPQLSYVLRYVTEDKGVKERFLKFEDVAVKKKAYDLAALIMKVLESYDCKTKVVAQSYDGVAVTPCGLNTAQALVKETIPQALFVHCYAHALHRLISHGASTSKDCKIFFANLGGLAAFFTGSPKRIKLLDDICARRLPGVSNVRWNFGSRLVCTVHEKRAELVELFQHILDHAEVFDHDTVHCASGHLSHLKSFDFCFFLFASVRIFDSADVLSGILQNKTLDVQFSLERIAEFCQNLEGERGKFDGVFEAAVEAAGQPVAAGGKPDPRAHYRALHAAFINKTLTQIRNRFADHKSLLFVKLLDAQKFPQYKIKFPEAELKSLKKSYGAQFDLSVLRVELKVVYCMANFQGKSPADLLSFLMATGLAVSMSQLYALTCLILTLPLSAASAQRSFSALERIKAYSRSAAGETPPSLSIEKELLVHLKQQRQLHEDVIERFVKKDGRMDFIFK